MFFHLLKYHFFLQVKQALDRADIQMSNKEIRGLTLNAIKALTEGGEGDNKKKVSLNDSSLLVCVRIKYCLF